MELEEYRALRSAIREPSTVEMEPAAARLASVWRRIDDESRRDPREGTIAAGGAMLVERVRRRIEDATRHWWQPVPVFARAVVIVQLATCVVLGGLWLTSLRSAFLTAGGGTDDGTAHPQTLITVAFHPEATESMVSQLLRQVHGSIVAGPSTLGVYTVAVPIAKGHAEELAAMLETLRSRVDTIRYAEVVP